MKAVRTGALDSENFASVDARVSLHNACHARAQNIGFKSRELLNLIPALEVGIVERCSGHGGMWGFEKQNYKYYRNSGRNLKIVRVPWCEVGNSTIWACTVIQTQRLCAHEQNTL